MSLKVVVRIPISSVESTSNFSLKSPLATRSAPSVSFSMGLIIVLESRKLKSTEISSPTRSACKMMMSSSLLRLETVLRLSRM